MFTDIESIQPKELPKCDVCIIGAGAAGIEVARSFINSSLSVYLLEGGREEFDYKLQNLGYFTHNDLNIRHPENVVDITEPYDLDAIIKSTTILRQYGGAMNIWGGLWKHLDPIDLSDRSIYHLSPWPIEYQELQRYYDELIKVYGLKEWDRAEKDSAQIKSGLSFESTEIIPTIGLKNKELGYVGNKYAELLKKSENIKVILGANATEVKMSEDASHVHSVIFQSIEKSEISIQAKLFILACGTVENTRILLSTKEVSRNNRFLGKNLLTHPKASPTILVPASKKKGELVFNKGPGFQYGFRLSDHLLSTYGLPNHYLTLKSCKAKQSSGNLELDVFSVRFFLEQLPNADSQIILTDKKNALGLPIPHLEFRLCDKDITMFHKFFDVFNKICQDHNIGRMVQTSQMNFLENFELPSHFSGTTRMAKSSYDGVVDMNCKVFGVDNLYVSGGSVFPTVGSANPTFTILALAKRLADHILSL